jgi:carbonic anhydrase/uncharacterized membrane protein
MTEQQDEVAYSPAIFYPEKFSACHYLCDISFDYSFGFPTAHFTMDENNNKKYFLRFNYSRKKGSKNYDIIFRKKKYYLKEFTVHNRIHKSYPLFDKDVRETVLVHQNIEDSSDILLISVFMHLKSNNHISMSQNFFTEIVQNDIFMSTAQMPTVSDLSVKSNWSPKYLIPGKKSFLLYKGTFPYHFPNKNKEVTYIVLTEPINMRKEDFEVLSTFQYTSREEQNINFNVYLNSGISSCPSQNNPVIKTGAQNPGSCEEEELESDIHNDEAKSLYSETQGRIAIFFFSFIGLLCVLFIFKSHTFINQTAFLVQLTGLFIWSIVHFVYIWYARFCTTFLFFLAWLPLYFFSKLYGLLSYITVRSQSLIKNARSKNRRRKSNQDDDDEEDDERRYDDDDDDDERRYDDDDDDDDDRYNSKNAKNAKSENDNPPREKISFSSYSAPSIKTPTAPRKALTAPTAPTAPISDPPLNEEDAEEKVAKEEEKVVAKEEKVVVKEEKVAKEEENATTDLKTPTIGGGVKEENKKFKDEKNSRDKIWNAMASVMYNSENRIFIFIAKVTASLYLLRYVLSLFGSPFSVGKVRYSLNGTLCRNGLRIIGRGFSVDKCHKGGKLSWFINSPKKRKIFENDYNTFRKKNNSAISSIKVALTNIHSQINTDNNYEITYNNESPDIVKACDLYNKMFSKSFPKKCTDSTIVAENQE